MDRDELNTLFVSLKYSEVVVRPDGTLVTDDGGEWSPDQVAEAMREVAESLAKLTRIVEWAKKAPDYTPAKVTA